MQLISRSYKDTLSGFETQKVGMEPPSSAEIAIGVDYAEPRMQRTAGKTKDPFWSRSI